MSKKRTLLHIVKDKDISCMNQFIRQSELTSKVSVILIQAAVETVIPEIQGDVFVLSEDCLPEQKTSFPNIGYSEMLQMIFEAETVVTW